MFSSVPFSTLVFKLEEPALLGVVRGLNGLVDVSHRLWDRMDYGIT